MGKNISHYFITLCEHAGIIFKTVSKLLCITADNTSNNDMACDAIEWALYWHQIYNLNPMHHCLPCLAHVPNLAIVNIMSSITKIAAIETATAIWEFDPSLPDN
ncbi:hypothetical protein HD554DRAFT_2178012 [Boletus coccyginus]|nr:hypothetical protein HD554DRAFT_2178012 [Boletus coccyginus]